MRVTRIHVAGPLAPGREISLPEQAGQHLVRVLRLEVGASFVIFDGSGGEFTAEIAATGKQVRARVLSHDAVERESPLDITLLQGIARGERMDLIVQKATELGVTRIVPVIAERSVVKVDAKLRERKREHWQSIVISACEQCGRNRVPAVGAPLSLGDAIQGLPAGGSRCLLAADAQETLSATASASRGPVALLIGPEGGLADNERKFAHANQFVACRLGPRIMRTETAGLAALAALQAVAGDFK
jgi:16S rRNA (uracil1498-N3)-methyltransferase